MPSHDHHTRRILTRIEAGDKISQRSLAKELGIALGLTNLLIRRLVKKGWVKVINVRPNRVRYLITPTGIGDLITYHRSVAEYADMYAAVFSIIVVAAVTVGLLEKVETIYFRPEKRARRP